MNPEKICGKTRKRMKKHRGGTHRVKFSATDGVPTPDSGVKLRTHSLFLDTRPVNNIRFAKCSKKLAIFPKTHLAAKEIDLDVVTDP